MKLITALALLLMVAMPARADELMSVQEARAAALKGEIVLIDIRTPEEWSATGVPDVAHTIDLHGEKFVVKLNRLMQAHPDKPVAMICATGGRSSYVAKALEQRGITILNVREGMMGSPDGPGWLKSGLPVRAPDQPRVE